MVPRMLAHRKHIPGEVSAVKTVHWVYTVEKISGSNLSALIRVMIKWWHWVWPGLGLGLEVKAKALITRPRPSVLRPKPRPWVPRPRLAYIVLKARPRPRTNIPEWGWFLKRRVSVLYCSLLLLSTITVGLRLNISTPNFMYRYVILRKAYLESSVICLAEK